MGDQRCYAVEIAFESSDYELAVMARVIKDDCSGKPVAVLENSGVCAWHHTQILERRRSMQ
jgi:hypothetical protein